MDVWTLMDAHALTLGKSYPGPGMGEEWLLMTRDVQPLSSSATLSGLSTSGNSAPLWSHSQRDHEQSS